MPKSPISPYKAHKKEWENCTRCDLCKKRKQVVFMRGTIPCDVLFVGEAPGKVEDMMGKPFVAPSGNLLERMIECAKKSSKVQFTYAICNSVGCFPDESPPPIHAEKACNPKLLKEIELADPKLIVTLGKVSTSLLADVIKTRHMCCLYHPASLLRLDRLRRSFAIDREIGKLILALQGMRTPVLPEPF